MAYGYVTLTRKALNKGLKKKKPMRNLNKVNVIKRKKKGVSGRKPPVGGLISRSAMLPKGGPVKTKNIKLKKK